MSRRKNAKLAKEISELLHAHESLSGIIQGAGSDSQLLKVRLGELRDSMGKEIIEKLKERDSLKGGR